MLHKHGNTWIEDESACYPSGAQLRRGRAIYPDGRVRAIRCGIPDTFFTIPAHGRIGKRYVAGFIDSKEDGFHFNIFKRYQG